MPVLVDPDISARSKKNFSRPRTQKSLQSSYRPTLDLASADLQRDPNHFGKIYYRGPLVLHQVANEQSRNKINMKGLESCRKKYLNQIAHTHGRENKNGRRKLRKQSRRVRVRHQPKKPALPAPGGSPLHGGRRRRQRRGKNAERIFFCGGGGRAGERGWVEWREWGRRVVRRRWRMG
jgi:hypothetical protein